MHRKNKTKVFFNPNRFLCGNILFVFLILSSVASFIALSSIMMMQKQRIIQQFSKKILGRQQALLLAQFGFDRLKQLATSDAVAMAIKGDHLYFYRTDEKYIGENFSVEDLKKEGVTLDCDWEAGKLRIIPKLPKKAIPLCKFQSDGLRLMLEAAMKTPECFPFLTNEQVKTAQRRWQALSQPQNVPLSIPLFMPILKEVNADHCLFWNPYDRELEGRLSMVCEGYQIINGVLMPRSESLSPIIAIKPGKMQRVFFPLSSVHTFMIQNTQACYNVPIYLNRYNPFFSLKKQYTHTFTCGSFNQKSWYRANSVLQTLPKTSVITSFLNQPLFYTKNWIQKLNACFSFSEEQPFFQIGNIHSDCEVINRFIWNEIVADNKGTPFYFNGTESNLQMLLKKLLGQIFSKEVLQIIAQHISKNQPYFDGYDFIQKLQTLQIPNGRMQDYLHVFQAICSRVETFSIEAKTWDKCYIYHCVMDVKRNPVTKSWCIEAIRYDVNRWIDKVEANQQ